MLRDVDFLVPVAGPLFSGAASQPIYNGHLLDAAGEKLSVIFQVPKSGNIRTIRFRTGTVTTGQTLRVGVYTVDSSGLPTTSAYGGMTVGTVAVADSDDNVLKTVTLAADAAATIGDWVAVTIEWDSAAGNLNIASLAVAMKNAYMYHASEAPARPNASPVMAIGYSDGSYPAIMGLYPFASGITATGYNLNTGTADEYALRFVAPFKGRLRGILLWGFTPAAGADFEFINYDGTTPVETGTNDGDYTAGSGGQYMQWDTGEVLERGDVRRLSVRPTTTTNISIVRVPVADAAVMQSMPGGGEWYQSNRLDQGAWTDVTTEFPMIFPVFDQIEDGSIEDGSASIEGDLEIFGVGAADEGTMYAMQVSTGVVTTTAVNSDGSFEFANVAPGEYMVWGVVTHDSMEKTTQVRIETAA